MIGKLPDTIIVTCDSDEISKEVLQNEKHYLCGETDAINRDIYLKFSSREEKWLSSFEQFASDFKWNHC
jgi:hypothetical protein